MKLQLAIDELNVKEALAALETLAPYVDIVEVGTPLLIDAGRDATRQIHKKFPELKILCDAKIMDAGAYEARLAYEAGAEYVTVLGVTDDLTIKECVNEAKKYGKKVMVDMICIPDLAVRVPVIEALGVDVIAVHTGVDQQAIGRTPLDDLIEIQKHVKSCEVAVAGGINSKTVDQYIARQPDILIVGGGILKSENPMEEAGRIRKLMED